jgi:hypothetical protein
MDRASRRPRPLSSRNIALVTDDLYNWSGMDSRCGCRSLVVRHPDSESRHSACIAPFVTAVQPPPKLNQSPRAAEETGGTGRLLRGIIGTGPAIASPIHCLESISSVGGPPIPPGPLRLIPFRSLPREERYWNGRISTMRSTHQRCTPRAGFSTRRSLRVREGAGLVGPSCGQHVARTQRPAPPACDMQPCSDD